MAFVRSAGSIERRLHQSCVTQVVSQLSVRDLHNLFLLGCVRHRCGQGAAGVTVFRVGSIVLVSLTALLYLSFGVLFPRIVRSVDSNAQEQGVGWVGKVVGWSSGVAFICLALLGPDLVRLLGGREDRQATYVLWICSAALCVDVSFHGVVQVIFARGEQGFLAKYTWIELIVNLTATVAGVELFGPVGSAWALAVTILVTDVIGFPIIMRGRWGTPAGRFVWSNGVLQSMAAAAVGLGLAVLPVLHTSGVVVHVVIVAIDALVCLALGLTVAGSSGRVRVMSLLRTMPRVNDGST